MKASDSTNDRTHLRDYWRVAWQGRWLVISILLVVGAMVGVATYMQTPIYRATTRIEVQPRAKSISPDSDFSQLGTSSWSWAAEDRYMNTQMQIIESSQIAQTVIDDLGLENSPQFAGLRDPAKSLAGRIQLRLLVDTYVFELSIEDKDPVMAQMLANAVANAYIESNVEVAINNGRRVIDELFKQIEPIKAAIAEKQAERITLARDNKFYIPNSEEETMDERLRQLQLELTELQISKGEREAVFAAIEDIERRGESYLLLPTVANDPLIKTLQDQTFNLQQELERVKLAFREGHPKYLEVKTKLRDMPAKIEEEAEKIIAKIKTEYAIDRRREKDLVEQVRLSRLEGLDVSETSDQLAILDAEIKGDQRIYELIMSKVKQIDLNQDTLVNNARLLEPATLPRAAVRPNKILNIGAGLILGLFLGLGVVFFVDYLDNTIKSTEDVEKLLNLPLLAIVPRFVEESSGAVNEAFQTLRTSILFASKGRSLKAVLVTSAGPGEGKTSTVVRLARTLAMAGDRVMLVDADLRRPTVHAQVGLERQHGLTDYLMSKEGGSTWSQYAKQAPDAPNLSVLTCGTLPPNPPELFGSPRFHEFLNDLRGNFDWVLLDSPPLASMSDSIVLASIVDMAVMVIKYNEKDREFIRRSKDELLKVDANLIGATLNNVDLRRSSYKDYYYASYHYVGEGKPEQSEPPAEADELRESRKNS